MPSLSCGIHFGTGMLPSYGRVFCPLKTCRGIGTTEEIASPFAICLAGLHAEAFIVKRHRLQNSNATWPGRHGLLATHSSIAICFSHVKP